MSEDYNALNYLKKQKYYIFTFDKKLKFILHNIDQVLPIFFAHNFKIPINLLTTNLLSVF